MIETEQIAEIIRTHRCGSLIRRRSFSSAVMHVEDARDDSDVDLLVVAETDLPLRDRFPAVRRLLADFPAAFDVFWKTPDEYRRWRDVVNHVVYFAEKYGRVVYERQDARSGAAMVG